jgi:tRNA pseudouridine32 synthase/23S rRNA pseudouridine746 synthase
MFVQNQMFHPFLEEVNSILKPEKFTFPFYYEAHPLAKLAAETLQNHLETQTDWEHNFGLDSQQNGLMIGKMFGVLVVENTEGKLGFLAAFSGKLAESNHIPGFVPPVFDLLLPDGFFKKEEEILNQINRDLEALLAHPEYLQKVQSHQKIVFDAEEDILNHKNQIKKNKISRDEKRIWAEQNLDFEPYKLLQKELSQQSKEDNILLKKMNHYWGLQKLESQKEFQAWQDKINQFKELRKQKSSELQRLIFTKYTFLNAKNEFKSLGAIFENNPPAGAGECAAPKLLHYAFANGFQPITMAEFWWGQSPKSEVRQHQQFYPACRSKCEPILNHMLQGLDVDENPLLQNPAEGQELTTVFEDEWLLVVDKPAEFLSVPGKNIQDSVYERMKLAYPKATGPLIVHRLDMSTSGLLLIAKSEEIYKKLQAQFIQRTIQKRYVALLDGILDPKSGIIDLPLRVDLDNRPQQLVCYEYGKKAQTRFEVIEVKNNQTKVYFYPITGRTHQLRVHAAHAEGLHCPIVGDDLYGTKGKRLCLHAEQLIFKHPMTGDKLTVQQEANF